MATFRLLQPLRLVSMVSSQESGTGPTATNGVVGSFYDFFAKLYSSSFTANPPWATVQGGSATPADPLGALQPAAPWADGLEYPPNPAMNGVNRQEDRRRHQEARHQEADFHPYKDDKGAERGRKPHRLEFGWPEDDAGNLKVHMRTPKVSGNGRSRESLRAPKPEGFPEPTDLPQNLSSRGLREQREQKQREMKEQRDQAARQQEEWLRRQQSELREQREQYLQEQEAKLEERLPSNHRDHRDPRERRVEPRGERSEGHGRERERKDNNYKADPEDLIDQHVAYFLRKNPEVKGRHKIERARPNTYLLDNREVQIEWQYATEPGGQGFLVVVDGPLRQPFSDYMRDTEENATYDGLDIVQSNLHGIRRDLRMSFNDSMKVYNRLEAMKVAKEQALFREKAAALTKEGIEVPQDELEEKYRKIIDMKLGHGRTKGIRPRNDEPPPSPEPPATQPPSPQPAQPAAPAAPAPPAPSAVPYAPPASPAPHTPARLSAASPAPVGRMHSGQAPQLIGYGSYCPSPKPSARAEGVQGGSTPGLPVPSPIPMRQQWTPSNPVLLGAGTPTSITTQPYKTQLPQTWRVHHTPRTPSGGIVGMDLPQLDPKKATAGAPLGSLGLAPNPFEEPNIFADRYAPSLYNREVNLFPSAPAPGRPRLHYDY